MGAASSLYDNLKEFDMGFRGTDDQRNLTPFQRQILDAERGRRAKKKKEQREKMRKEARPNGQTPSRPTNSRAGGSSGNSQEETVRYINKNENPDFEAPE